MQKLPHMFWTGVAKLYHLLVYVYAIFIKIYVDRRAIPVLNY